MHNASSCMAFIIHLSTSAALWFFKTSKVSDIARDKNLRSVYLFPIILYSSSILIKEGLRIVSNMFFIFEEISPECG